MAKTRYVKTALTGGGATALDGIVITTPLLTNDFAFVVVGNVATMYNFDATSSAAESSPDVINPDGNAGNGRWLLQNLQSTGFTGTSATSVAIGTGSKTFTIQLNKAFVIGMSVLIADTAAPATNWMHGAATAYTASTGELIVTVTTVGGSGTKTAWTVSLSAPILEVSIPAATKMLFYADTAPAGWTIDNTLDDKLVYVTKGSAAGGQTGGAAHSAGTWTQPNHTHTGPSHTHTGPSHTHTGPSHTHTTPAVALSIAEMPAHSHPGSTADGTGHVGPANTQWHTRTGTVYYGFNEVSSAVAVASQGSGSTHAHGDTGAGGTGATGAEGTGATGADGTGATGNGATANTWRPAAYSMIICTKN
jgi:hypothetical protein